MQYFNDFVDYLNKGAYGNPAAIDFAHAVLLYGVAISAKPERILNLGIGPGVSVNTLLKACRFNGMGRIVAVDNNHDLGGNMPHKTVDQLRADGIEVVISEECDYVFGCESNSFDLIVSDADHEHAGEWVDQILRIARPNAFIFVHDADNKAYPGLKNYLNHAKKAKLPYYLFNKGGNGTLRAPHTGWLMMVNLK